MDNYTLSQRLLYHPKTFAYHTEGILHLHIKAASSKNIVVENTSTMTEQHESIKHFVEEAVNYVIDLGIKEVMNS